MAVDLATSELEAERAQVESEEERRAKQLMVDRLVDVNRRQYSKLLGLERREMANQKAISDTWVKFVYLLLETTMAECEADDTLFFNLDQFAQTMLLREVANKLRADQGLPAYDVVYVFCTTIYFFCDFAVSVSLYIIIHILLPACIL